MPIVREFHLPGSARELELPSGPNARLFVIFISSEDPETKQPWCPDVRAAWPHIVTAFGGRECQAVSVVEVGQRPE